MNFEETIEEEEDRDLDESHAQLVDDLRGEEDLEPVSWRIQSDSGAYLQAIDNPRLASKLGM